MQGLTGQRGLAQGLPSCHRLTAGRRSRVFQPLCFAGAEAQRQPRGGISALPSLKDLSFGARRGSGCEQAGCARHVAASAQARRPTAADLAKEAARKNMRTVRAL